MTIVPLIRPSDGARANGTEEIVEQWRGYGWVPLAEFEAVDPALVAAAAQAEAEAAALAEEAHLASEKAAKAEAALHAAQE